MVTQLLPLILMVAINITPTVPGAIVLDGFQFPRNGDGSAGQFPEENSSGELEFAAVLQALLFLRTLER